MARPSLNELPTTGTIKFLCSYGGKILPRYPDGKLRYYGGETRVLAVDRSVAFSELLVKLRELCGMPVALRCQLPTEDLDALVSITSDEDLVNLIEEYDRTAIVQSPANLKIRAFLSLPKKSSSTPSTDSSAAIIHEIPSPKSSPPRIPIAATNYCIQQMLKPPRKLPLRYEIRVISLTTATIGTYNLRSVTDFRSENFMVL